MILPIYTFGNSVLRKIAEPIDQDYPGLKDLIKNMYDTMVHAEGVGLAAPQVGIPIRLIVIDLAPLKEDNPELGDFKVTMINPELLEESENEVEYDEGCLSIPGINETDEIVNMAVRIIPGNPFVYPDNLFHAQVFS